MMRNQETGYRHQKRDLYGSLRWMEANVASLEVESEEWRRLLPHQRCVAIDVIADGREGDFFPQNGKWWTREAIDVPITLKRRSPASEPQGSPYDS
ncbi:hypothetical protein Tco_0210351 [Tanacetum coccineum]